MTSKPPRIDSGLYREILVVIALTILGGLIRLWDPGRLGLIHFDEGIYALTGLWSLSPRGLAGIDPTVISYAPPGFPVLVGLSYLLFGVNDLAAILVSICSGTLTIPAAAWLARRTFGPGAGGVAAAFAALSGPHIAFSRMALTDASFLLCWLVALALGQRFLERPNPARALSLGLAVGLAQLFKYNGWISGAIVPLGALMWLVFHRGEWRTRWMPATWAWGLLAAIVAAVVYWPWFEFVDARGGYRALLAHQRSYLGGPWSWPGHWSLQLAQNAFLSGGPLWLLGTGALAALGMAISSGDLTLERRLLPRILWETSALAALCLVPGFSWWIVLTWISVALLKSRGQATKSVYLVCIGWTTVTVFTPFYHPYARLWLPVEAFGWILLAGVFTWIRTRIEVAGRGARWTLNCTSDPLPWFSSFCVLSALVFAGLLSRNQHMCLLGPSDSLRQAARTILNELPPSSQELRVYARPAVPFYLALAGGISVYRQPDLEHLLEPGTSNSWAVLDLALIRQENMQDKDLDPKLAGWVLVREIPTLLNPPTLLDIDPATARGGTIDASAPVRLLRRRRMEDVR